MRRIGSHKKMDGEELDQRIHLMIIITQQSAGTFQPETNSQSVTLY
jgi:hypothetical protein